MVVKGGYGVPDRINEKGNYLRLFFTILGAVRAGLHVYKDESALRLSTTNPTEPQEPTNHSYKKLLVREILRVGRGLAVQMVLILSFTTVLSIILYSTVFRRLLWHLQVLVARALYSISRTEAHPPSGFYLGTVIIRAFLCGILLLVSWQLNIILFNMYIIQEPSEKGVMLSSSSKDPNGTLLNGLNAKDLFTRTFAFWELDIVARTQTERRQRIFIDIDRPTGPVITNMVQAAIKTISAIDVRIGGSHAQKLTSTQTAAPESGENVHTLPRLLPPSTPSRTQVFATPRTGSDMTDRVGAYVASGARTLGSSVQPWSPPIGAGKQKVVEYSSPVVQNAKSQVERVRVSPVAQFLLPSPARNINVAILGSPRGNAAVTMYALSSVTTLLSASLKEDVYGKAIGSVPSLVMQITATINAVESFVSQQLPNKTITKSEEKELEESIAVYSKLRSSLGELLSAFQMFLSDQGLSIVDLNEATRASRHKELFKVIPDQPKIEDGKKTSADRQREMQEVKSSSLSDSRHERERQRTRSRHNEDREQEQTSSRKPSDTTADKDEAVGAQHCQESIPRGSTGHLRSASNTDQERDQGRRPGRLFKHLDAPRDTAARGGSDTQAVQRLQRQKSSGSSAATGRDFGEGSGLNRRVTSEVGA